jgi:rhodanese-related sulfurtransferase
MANPAPAIRRISQATLQAWIDERRRVTIVDVRDPEAFFSSSLTILGAACIPPDQLATRYAEIPRQDPVVAFGADPEDDNPERLARLLLQHGYPNVSVLADGFLAWEANGYAQMARPGV